MTLDAIAKQVCADHGIAWRELMGRSQYKYAYLARADAYGRMRAADVPVVEIGDFFDRDESTVWRLLKKRCRPD